jgi:multiple sugar transport system permease protein
MSLTNIEVPVPNEPVGTPKKKSNAGRYISAAVLVIVTVIMLLPVFYMISTALKSNVEIRKVPPTIIPSQLHFENFGLIFSKIRFGTYFFNSIFVAVLVLIGTLLSSSLVSFGFARYKAREKNLLFMLLLSTLMLPYPSLIIPQYLLFRNIGWVDSFLPLIIPSFFGSAYMIFLLKQFFSSLPNDLFDAAKIDGCSEFRTWWNIALPLCKPAMATVSIFTFLWTWNDFITPVIYLNTDSKFTLPIGMSGMISAFRLIPWNLIMVGSIYSLLPVFILFFIAQKYFVEGIVLTGLK